MTIQIPLPKGFNSIDSLPKLRENLINCFNPGNNTIISTPGLQSFTQGFGITRGFVLFKDELYAASGSRFCKIASDGFVTNIAQLTGTQRVEFATSFTEIAIVNVQTGDGFIYDGSTYTAIGGSYVASVDVASIGGRAVYCPADGSPVFYSAVNDFGTIAGFVDAEFLPDLNTGVWTYKNNLFIGGENSIQKFRLSPDNDFPLVPASGSEIQAGYLSGHILYAKGFAFLGRNRNQGYGFFWFSQGEAQEISNDAVREVLREYTKEELQACQSQTYERYGYEILQFTIESDVVVSRTFAFVNGQWFFCESGINGPNVQASYRGKHIILAYGDYIIGDRLGNKIGKFTEDSEEYGNQLEREILTFARGNRGEWFELPNLTVDAYVGSRNLTNPYQEPTMGLEMSDDGVVFAGDQIFAGLGVEGDYSRRTEFEGPGGLGRYETYAGIRLRTTEAVTFGVDGLQIGDRSNG